MKTNLKQLVEKKNLANAEKCGSGISSEVATVFVANDSERRAKCGDAKKDKAFNEAADELEDATARLNSAIDKLMIQEKRVVSESKAAVSKAKDTANQLGDQLARISKILGSDFLSRLEQLERFVSALEALKRLDEAGKLDKLLSALR